MRHRESTRIFSPLDEADGWEDQSIPGRLSEQIAHVIRKAILSGALRPGAPLRERNLAEELRISRTPVREALFILQGEGLVDLSHNRGARVAHVTASDIEHIYSLRRVLEAHAARSAAESGDRAKLAKAAEALDAQRRLPPDASPLDQARADLAFHEAIAAAAGSQLLHTVAHQVFAVTITHRSRYGYTASHAKHVCRQHRAILKAIEAGDADAAELLMGEHVAQSSRLALKHLKRTSTAEDDGTVAASPNEDGDRIPHSGE